MRISIFCWVMIVLLVLPASSAVAENAGDDKTDGDPFTGTWYGRLSGEGLYQHGSVCEFHTGFTMEILSMEVIERYTLLPSSPEETFYDTDALVIVHYDDTVYKGPGNCVVDLRTATVVGTVNGSTTGFRDISLYFEDVRPEGTYSYYDIEGRPDPTNPHRIRCDWIYFALIPPSPSYYKIHVEVDDGGKTLHLHRSEIVLDPTGEMLDYKWEIEGVLHKVDDESYDFPEEVPPDEKISTDKHTRKKVNIPGVGEVIAGPESEFKIESSSGGKTTLEQFKGDLMHRVKELAEEGRSFEVLTPQAVCGVRGTTFLTNVREGETVVVVFDGSVEVSDKDGGNSLTVRKGQMVVVEEGTFPASPVSFTANYPDWLE